MSLLTAVFLLLFSFNSCLAETAQNSPSPQTSPPSQIPIPKLPSEGLKNPLPELGTCSEHTDYYISQCQPFSCFLGIANTPGVYREMTTLGFQGDKCLHKITLKVRHPDFRQGDIHISCKLSPEGRAEMANLFTRYKKGDLSAYTKRSLDPKLGKECRH